MWAGLVSSLLTAGLEVLNNCHGYQSNAFQSVHDYSCGGTEMVKMRNFGLKHTEIDLTVKRLLPVI